MLLTILPLAVSAVAVHVFLDRAALTSFDDVATRYRDQITPAQRLQVLLWEAAAPVEEFLDAREPTQQQSYRDLRVRIETGFSSLRTELDLEASRTLLERAELDWARADGIATELLAHTRALGDANDIELADRFAALIGTTVDKLRAVENHLSGIVAADHADAVRDYERARWASVIAAGVSLLAMVMGVVIIVRVMMANVERLVDGARKFAEGDRTHRIAVSVPPELREVADEFNRMIVRIHEAEDALAAQARSDVLTGLPNRRAFEEVLTAAFARMRRMKEPVVLLSLDIDHFKRINDTHGHAAGDEVLRVVGRTIGSAIREVDKAFRVGGEEFAVLLAGTDIPGAMIAAERLRAAIASHPASLANGRILAVTASIGVAAADSAKTPDALLHAADEALYAAKSAGRDRVVVASLSP